jgi:hypothetical protein
MLDSNLALKNEPNEPLAPRPRSSVETGLTQGFLCDLLAKHFYGGGVLNQQQLVERTALAWPVLENLLNFMRAPAISKCAAPLKIPPCYVTP